MKILFHPPVWLSFLTVALLSLSLLMESVRQIIHLNFPNDQIILGVGGLVYDKDTNIWTASSENIPGSPVDEEFPLASSPRIYPMMLDFQAGRIEFVNNGAILVEPSYGLNIEDIYMAPSCDKLTSSENQLWLVSEAYSHLFKTTLF